MAKKKKSQKSVDSKAPKISMDKDTGGVTLTEEQTERFREATFGLTSLTSLLRDSEADNYGRVCVGTVESVLAVLTGNLYDLWQEVEDGRARV